MSKAIPKQAPLLFGVKVKGDTANIVVPGVKGRVMAMFCGRGTFSNVFYHSHQRVYVYTKHGDLSKDILAHTKRKGNPHIPVMKYLGESGDDTDVYQTHFYRTPIVAGDNPIVWRQVLALQKAHKEASRTFQGDIIATGQCIDFNYYIAENADVPDKLKEALTRLTESAADWGNDYLFDDFRVSNLGVDKQGRLVFIDAMFDAGLVQREARKRRAR